MKLPGGSCEYAKLLTCAHLAGSTARTLCYGKPQTINLVVVKADFRKAQHNDDRTKTVSDMKETVALCDYGHGCVLVIAARVVVTNCRESGVEELPRSTPVWR